MKRILVALACLLAPTLAVAQAPPDETKKIRQGLEVAYVGLQVLDLHTAIRDLTQQADQARLRGASGVGGPRTAYHGGGLIVTHVVATTATIYATEQIAKTRPKLALLILTSVTIAETVVVMHKYRLLNATQ